MTANGAVDAGPSRRVRAAAFHLLAVSLVIAYANAFVLWGLVGDTVGVQVRDASPFAVMIVAVLAVHAVWRRQRARTPAPPRAGVWLAAAVLLAAAGLAIADPDFPAKRIHVPEYAFLAVIVWMALDTRFDRMTGVVMVFAVTGLYGIHDEILQGFHPFRTYGLRDIAVNLCGAGAGTCLMHAIAPFRRTGSDPVAFVTFTPALAIALAMAGIGAGLAAIALTAFRHDILPLWTTVPALAAAVVVAVRAERSPGPPGLRVVGLQLLVLSLYPVVTHVVPLDFA